MYFYNNFSYIKKKLPLVVVVVVVEISLAQTLKYSVVKGLANC